MSSPLSAPGRRRFRLLVGGTVVAIAAALAIVLSLNAESDGGDGWQTLHDSASGVTVSYPREWKVQQFGHYCHRVGPGLLVSNLREHRFENVKVRQGCTNEWELSGLPGAYVLVDVSLFGFPRNPVLGEPEETAMPLELSRFERSPEQKNFASATVTRNGLGYSVRAWFGPTASREDQQAVARVIRSIELRGPG